MAGIPQTVGKILISPLAAVASAVVKKPKAPAASAGAPPVPSRNLAYEAARRNMDSLRRRRGAGANEITGGGAEAPRSPGAKTLLGQ